MKKVEEYDSYCVVINNKTKKVESFNTYSHNWNEDEVQELVNKLIENKMITLFGENITDVNIEVWDIGDDKGLYIETYHNNPDISDNELFDEYDRSMLYEDFLKL